MREKSEKKQEKHRERERERVNESKGKSVFSGGKGQRDTEKRNKWKGGKGRGLTKNNT